MVSLPDPPSDDHSPREWASFPYDLRFPSDVRFVERAVELVIERCRSVGLAPHALTFNVPVALTEALSNAILYGNHEDTTKAVRITAHLTDAALVLEVHDQGPGFDLDACTCDPTSLENLQREDGRGLFLMRQLMDSVEQSMQGENMVRLTLRRT